MERKKSSIHHENQIPLNKRRQQLRNFQNIQKETCNNYRNPSNSRFKLNDKIKKEEIHLNRVNRREILNHPDIPTYKKFFPRLSPERTPTMPYYPNRSYPNEIKNMLTHQNKHQNMDFNQINRSEQTNFNRNFYPSMNGTSNTFQKSSSQNYNLSLSPRFSNKSSAPTSQRTFQSQVGNGFPVNSLAVNNTVPPMQSNSKVQPSYLMPYSRSYLSNHSDPNMLKGSYPTYPPQSIPNFANASQPYLNPKSIPNSLPSLPRNFIYADNQSPHNLISQNINQPIIESKTIIESQLDVIDHSTQRNTIEFSYDQAREIAQHFNLDDLNKQDTYQMLLEMKNIIKENKLIGYQVLMSNERFSRQLISLLVQLEVVDNDLITQKEVKLLQPLQDLK